NRAGDFGNPAARQVPADGAPQMPGDAAAAMALAEGMQHQLAPFMRDETRCLALPDEAVDLTRRMQSMQPVFVAQVGKTTFNIEIAMKPAVSKGAAANRE